MDSFKNLQRPYLDFEICIEAGLTTLNSFERLFGWKYSEKWDWEDIMGFYSNAKNIWNCISL